MAINVQPDSPLAQAIQHAVQPKLVDNGWVGDEGDNTLAEYVTSMITRGITKPQMVSEMGTDLIGTGDDDPAVTTFADWLFEVVPALDAQISGREGATTGGHGNTTQQDEQHEQSQDMQMDTAQADNIPSGPKAMREGGRGRGRMLGQLNKHLDRSGDDKMLRIKGAAGSTGRINSHSGRDNNRRGRGGNFAHGIQRMMGGRPGQQGGMPMMDPQQQMQLMQMMEMQNQMMAQMLNGQAPDMRGFTSGTQHKSRSLFERVDKGGKPNKHITGGMGANMDTEMAGNDDSAKQGAFDTMCRFNDKCTNPNCPYAHQSPAAPPGTSVDLTDVCSFGAACENRKCAGKHPSPAQRRQHLGQEVDCKFYPNCTNPSCPFRHPDMPACRNGADCTKPDCKFSHSKIMCRYNPCLNPACIYKHVDGQKRGKFADKVWTADRLKGLTEHHEQTEELIIPNKDADMNDGDQPVEIVT